MKRSKILLTIGAVIVAIGLVIGAFMFGKGTKNTSSTQGKNDYQLVSTNDQSSDPVAVGNFKLHFGSVEKTTLNDKDKKAKLYVIKVDFENISNDAAGLGALDFRIKDNKGKWHNISSKYTAFGKSFDSNAKGQEKLYFELDNVLTPAKLQYKTVSETATWDFKR